MKEVFEKENIKCYIKSYEIIVTGPDSGFLEFVKDSMSIDSLKKKYSKYNTLKKLYDFEFRNNLLEA